jgi:YVTN family beta-propeller protein
MIVVGSGPRGVAVNQTDDTVYVVNSADDSVSVINGKTNTVVSTIIAGDNPRGVAVDQTDDTVYVTNADDYTVSVINGRTNTVNATIGLSDGPNGVAVDGAGTNSGLIYVTRDDASVVSMIGRVVPSLSAASGSPGASVTLSVAAPQVTYDVDDSTVTSVHFGDDTATGLTAGAGNSWSVTVPAGSGTVPVTVTFNGGLTASAGTFTYGSPTPTPPTPASAPRDVSATAGDASATITWTAPASSGDYPITSYQATSTPAGRTCLVAAPALTCEITELTNRTRYTFTVQALTGAGWGETSIPSNAVTPEPSTTPTIVITGYRGSGAASGRVYANGTTTGLAGEVVRARVKVTGETDYRDGSTRTVSANETFTWQRKTGKKTHVYFTHNETRSNSITIPAR